MMTIMMKNAKTYIRGEHFSSVYVSRVIVTVLVAVLVAVVVGVLELVVLAGTSSNTNVVTKASAT